MTRMNWQRFRDACIEPLLCLFFPRLCPGCDQEVLHGRQPMCLTCMHSLPHTGFEHIDGNPVEKVFWGRVDVSFACSSFYYIENTPLQKTIHQIKYKEDARTGIILGKWMGVQLKKKMEVHQIDLMIPMPLHPKKEKQRGYNQAALLCKGMAATTGIGYCEKTLVRDQHTRSQTNMSKLKRWENVSSVFGVRAPARIQGKHLLLVDDVITTGASTEACMHALFANGAASVGVCSLAFTP